MTARTSRAPGLGARGGGAPGPAHATRGRILDVEDCLPTRSNRESRIPLGESRSFEDRRRPHPTRPSTAADGHHSDPGRARRTGGLEDQELAQRSESARHDAPEEPDEGHAEGWAVQTSHARMSESSFSNSCMRWFSQPSVDPLPNVSRFCCSAKMVDASEARERNGLPAIAAIRGPSMVG